VERRLTTCSAHPFGSFDVAKASGRDRKSRALSVVAIGLFYKGQVESLGGHASKSGPVLARAGRSIKGQMRAQLAPAL
jgi:hypothetical protein